MNTVTVKTMSTIQPVEVYKTSIGRKIVMAISGFLFISFVIGHMVGNLQVFIGQDQINAYAETLQSLGALLWFERLFFLAFFLFHIFFGIVLYLENYFSRPISYKRTRYVESTLSSRTMIFSGLLMFSFVVYHLLHYTLVVTNPEYAGLTDNQGRFDVYSMIILGFSNYIISAVYIVAILCLALHINHGLFSLVQTIGWTNAKWLPRIKRIGNLAAVLIFLGYVSIPLGVIFNIIQLPEGGIR